MAETEKRKDLLLMAACFFCFIIRPAEVKMGGGKSPALRKSRQLFDFIRVVTFPNYPCQGSGDRQGTCYTPEECVARGGSSSGLCASGFGVCCVFTVGCSGMRAENCTYFDASGIAPGACAATVCPMDSSICQLRLDFDTFSVAGPSTATPTALTQVNGRPSTEPGVQGAPVSLASRCLTDTFSVTSPDAATPPPVICGTNSGEHMYVDSSASCNDLTFHIGTATTSTIRSWSIKVTQYDCDFDNLAPKGCTQYFFGSNIGRVSTYNYQSGQGRHLADQSQTQCIRRERGNCRLCLLAAASIDWQIPSWRNQPAFPVLPVHRDDSTDILLSSLNGFSTTMVPGSYGYDCLIVPNAASDAAGNPRPGSRYCGRSLSSTVCTTAHPFVVRFMSDGFEATGGDGITEAELSADVGYGLVFFMDSLNC